MLEQKKAFDAKRFWNGAADGKPEQASKSTAKTRRRAKGAGCVLEA
jgi:hypothetical protein